MIFYYAPLIGIILATLADILTTRAALKRDGTREANPVMKFFMNYGISWILVKIAITVIATAWFYFIQFEILLWPFVLVLFYFAWSNTKKGRK